MHMRSLEKNTLKVFLSVCRIYITFSGTDMYSCTSSDIISIKFLVTIYHTTKRRLDISKWKAGFHEAAFITKDEYTLR